MRALISVSLLFFTTLLEASVLLIPGGGPLPLAGTTAAAEADLAGVVVHDAVHPFRIVNAAGALLFEGKLQDRVVKSNRGGVLHFYSRIRDTTAGLNGIVDKVFRINFGVTPKVAVDWRSDGLGTVPPGFASRSGGIGDALAYWFAPGQILVGGSESRFFFAKTRSTQYDLKGRTIIRLTTGDSVTLFSARPL